jgi:hemerythrin-like metal-binding protein
MDDALGARDLDRFALDVVARGGLLALAVVREGIVLSANERFRVLFALGEGEAPGFALWSRIAPADRARVERALATLTEGKPQTIVFGVRSPEGGERAVEVTASAGALPDGPAAVLLANERAQGLATGAPSRPPEPESLPPPFLAWAVVGEVGVAIIDEQHRVLVDLVNEVAEDLRLGRDRDAVLASLRSLMRFTAEHFATEERLMYEQGGGEGEAEHRKEHRKLFQEVRTLMAGLDVRAPAETMEFLRRWLLAHVMETDRPFGEWLHARGVR